MSAAATQPTSRQPWELRGLRAHRFHPVQHALRTDPHRFKVVAAGRRSGKTEEALRWLLRSAVPTPEFPDPRCLFAAPTHQQAIQIAWHWFLRVIPRESLIRGAPRSTEREFWLKPLPGFSEHPVIRVAGMDKPARIEGVAWDYVVLDEYADMKKEAWSEHLQPCLATPGRPPGQAWFVGTPNGAGDHFYQLALQAPTQPNWNFYTWPSADIVDPELIEQAERDLDPRTFRQEYLASFESPVGQIYYGFGPENVAIFELPYRHDGRVDIRWQGGVDFNVHPITAVYGWIERDTVYVWDEVYINGASTEELGQVLAHKIRDWDPDLKDDVELHPDPTGQRRQTSQQQGKTDWHLLRALGFKLTGRTRPPPVRDRYNAVNSRLRSGVGKRRLFIHPQCKNLIRSLTAASYDDEKGEASHICDALGYWVECKFPVKPAHAQLQVVRW